MDPTRLKTVKPVLIDQDLACVKCGYNLVGLMTGGVCPECGRKISVRVRDLPRYSDSLVNAPLAWLRGLATGSLLLFLSSIGLFVSLGVAAGLAGRSIAVGALVALGIGVVWYVGVWLVTRPRPVMPSTTVDPKKEWGALRWSARGTQIFWGVSALLLAGYAKSPEPLFVWMAIGSFVIAALGLIPLCGLVSNIAYWGSDTALAGHFRACAWSVGFAAVLIALHIINILTHSLIMGGFIASAIAALLIFFAVMPFFYVVFSCFQLQGMTRWAMFNNAAVDAKTQRLREKAAASAAAKSPEADSHIESVDLGAFNLGDSTVDSGGEQRLDHRQGYVVQPKPHDESPLPVDQAPIRRGRPPQTRT